MTEAERLNSLPAVSGRQALQQALRAQGDDWFELVTGRCPHLFAEVPVYISPGQLRQMKDVIAAVERVVGLEGWEGGREHEEGMRNHAKGVFYGYDFHLNADGAHLIEINTNAGGAYLVALLAGSQRDADLPGEVQAVADPEAAFSEMFFNEWRQARGDAPLRCVAIVDEQPEAQYLYPEFLLAKAAFERAGIAAYIADPGAFTVQEDGLYLGEARIDMIYNRLTDFGLQQHPVLREAYLSGQALVTPNPTHYARYADKRNLARLTDAEGLRALGAGETDIAALLAGVPRTMQVDAAEQWWATRKQWFFKPDSGYGSKGAYRGDKLTKRVFEEIMQGGYVAQRMAAPGERMICGGESLKYDVRCYVYDGAIQLIAARLYQGQTTNFRTPGGGFAQVRLVG